MNKYFKLIIISAIILVLSIPGVALAHGGEHHGNSGGAHHGGYGNSYDYDSSSSSQGLAADTSTRSNTDEAEDYSVLPICGEVGCRLTYNHTHDGVYYCGHYNGDGHEHNYSTYTRTSCNLEGCELTCNHAHDGRNYYGHHNEDGHNHNFTEGDYPECPAHWCSQQGGHCHAGTYYHE